MGYYVNPEGMSKEHFLAQHGRKVSQETALEWRDFSKELPVCLVENAMFSAAAIGVDAHEIQRFAHPDGRRKQWFVVARDLLKEWL